MTDPIEGTKAEGIKDVQAVLAIQAGVLKNMLNKTMNSHQHRLIYDAIQNLKNIHHLLEGAQ